MARYIKNHRRHIAGFAVPVFFLFIVGFLSFSIFPGWLKPTYGVPGAACSQSPNFSSGFSPDCDICNGELCLPNSANSNQLQCAAIVGNIVDLIQGDTSSFMTAPDFSPGAQAQQCPNGFLAALLRVEIAGNTSSATTLTDIPGLIYPACYTECVTSSFTTMDSSTGLNSGAGSASINILVPVCQPSNTFCQGISGGDGSNECRTAECVAQASPDATTGNPTGCEYEYVDAAQNEDCQLCTDATEAGIPACGNGVCEVDEGEDCSSCAVDCLLPGFEDSCPLTSGAVITDACNPIPSPSVLPLAVSAIVLPDGPPLDNFRGSLGCEDGDLCTDNACGADGSTCEATPKLPSGNTPDFCCPSGAAFPDSGSCGDLLGSNCDVDCYVPTECSVNVVELSGTGCGSSLTGMASPTTASGAWAMLGMISLALPMALRKRS